VRGALAGHRPAHCSESIVVGSEEFAQEAKTKPGMVVTLREVVQAGDCYALHESVPAYVGHFDNEIVLLSNTNRPYWEVNVRTSDS
jgi:hypothetical protein